MPIIDAVAVSTTDMARSVAFYAALGFDFSAADTSQGHVEPKHTPGSVRLMIDEASVLESITGEAPHPGSHSSFALLCADAAEVDALARAAIAAGGRAVKEPWDAFWGQRYAVLADPEGYKVDLFAPL